jgi:hypothetical protein
MFIPSDQIPVIRKTVQGVLGRLGTLPLPEVIDHARVFYGWVAPSADHVFLGLACLANDVGLAKDILSRHPHLATEPCVELRSMMANAVHPYPYQGGRLVSPLLGACTGHSWDVGRVLLACDGVDPGTMEKTGNLLWSPLLQVMGDATEVCKTGDVGPVMDFATALINAGAGLLDPNEEGNTALSFALSNLGLPIAVGEDIEEEFRVRILVVERLLPYLSELMDEQLTVEVAHKLGLGLSSLDFWENLSLESTSPSFAWFQKKTGIHLARYPECMLAWLFENGLGLSVFHDFAATHAPASLAFVSQKAMEHALPKAQEAEPKRPGLRL